MTALSARANRTHRSVLKATTAAMLLLIGVAPALSAEGGPDATISIGSLYEPQNLDNTAGAGQGINEAFNGNVYEALFRLNDDGSVSPSLVKDYTVSDDGLTYTFTLQPGVTFHSGDPLTSADVKWSIERVTSPDSKSSRKNSLKPIASIETPDDATVVIKLSSRSISLPYNLSYVWVINDAAKDLQATEDGTGPYALDGWQRGSQLAVKRFDKYWGPKPENGEVIFKYFTEATALNNALLTGAVDVITSVQSPDSLAQFKDNPDFTVAEGKSTTKLLLAYNDRVAPFDNVKVRKALARAVDDKKLLEAVWGEYGTLIGSFVPPTDPWYVDLTEVDAYDPESAKALLAEAGYPDGFEVDFACPNNRYVNDEAICQAVTAMWSRIGVKAKLRTLPLVTYFPMIQRNEASIYMLGWGVPTFDALYSLQSLLRSVGAGGDGNYNVGRYSNPQVDAMIERVKVETDLVVRNELIEKALVLANEDVAYLPLHNQVIPWAMRKNVEVIHRADNRLDWRLIQVK